jgi:hypothetical protein
MNSCSTSSQIPHVDTTTKDLKCAMMDSQQGRGKGSRAPPSGQIVFDGSMNQIASKKQTPRSPEEKLLSKLRRKHGWKGCELHKRQKKFCPCQIPVEWLERLASGSAVRSLLSSTAAAESIERLHSTDPDRQRRDIRISELRRTQSLESISGLDRLNTGTRLLRERITFATRDQSARTSFRV